MAEIALITLNELKNFPGMSSVASDQDNILLGLIDGATADFEAYWDNIGVQRTFTENYHYHDIKRTSPTREKIWLKHYPVVSVTSITDPDGNTVASTDYWIDKELGCLRTTGSWLIPQDSNGFMTYWTIIYVAGRVASIAAVPNNIKLACKLWIASLYKRIDREVIEKRVGDLQLRYKEQQNSEGLPAHIKQMIWQWKRVKI